MGENAISKAFAVNPAGRVVSQTPEQAIAGQDLGYQPVSEETAKKQFKAAADEKYVDENWGTAGKVAAGVASGATLGLGPALATKLGLLDPAHLEAAEQSGAYTAGEVGGFIAPALLSGGEGVVAKALAATPAGAVGRVGGLAERAVGRLLPEATLLGKTGAKVTQMAARGATEGALMNVAHETSQDIIQNKPLSAQAILASATDGALFGGVTAGVLGGAVSLAGAGAESLGARGLGAVGGKGERSAGVALKRLGVDASDYAAKEGGTVGAVSEITDLMKKGETSFAAPTSHIRKSMQNVAVEMEQTAKGALKDLGDIAKPGVQPVQNLANSLDQEWKVLYQGTADAAKAKSLFKGIVKDVKGATEWEQWAANRDILSREAESATGLKKAVYDSALEKFDAEFRAAGTAVDEGLFQQYASATAQKNLAKTLVESTGNKLGQEASRGNPLHLNQTDGGALGIGTLLGNPGGALGIVAARKITGYLQDRLEPVIAEYAARSSIGAKAGSATANVGSRISGALKDFMSGATKVASNVRAKEKATGTPNLSYTMKAYREAMDTADKLTSEAHQSQVREHLNQLTLAGHPELANQLGLTYGRAVADVKANRPKGTLNDKAPGSLGKTPKQMGLDTGTMKFLRRLHSMRDPVGTIVNGLEQGNLSRDAVASIKYVMPDLHAELVNRAAMAASEMRQEGRFLPADKLALLGVALDHPVDSKLQSDFINEVQQGLAANQKPPSTGGVPPPITDSSSYQTPLQSTV